MSRFRVATKFFVRSDIHPLISSFQPVPSSAEVGIGLSSTLSITDRKQMARSQPHLKLKVRGRPRYRARQSREDFLLRHQRLPQRAPHSWRGHMPGNNNTHGDRSDSSHGAEGSTHDCFHNETRNIAAGVDSQTSHTPTSFGSNVSSHRNPYSRSSRPLSLAVPKRRRLSENDLDQNQHRPPTKRRRVSEGDKPEEILGQQSVPITQAMPRVSWICPPREPQRQGIARDNRRGDPTQSRRHRLGNVSPLDDSPVKNGFSQEVMRDHPKIQHLATSEAIESEDKPIDSLVLCDQEPPNNDHITSLHPKDRTSISSALFDCFLVILNVSSLTYWYRQIFPYKPFQAVDWYQQAIDIAVMEITVCHVVLFGEAALEPMQWKGMPGLLPDPETTLNAGSTGLSDYEYMSIYKPWETSSNGTYVPEHPFLMNVKDVLKSALNDLTEIANHGPSQFRFTRGASTQFRWSTSSGSFISPHGSLPTILDDEWDAYIESEVPDSTILGMPPHDTGTPSPTARPREQSLIMNSDPPLSRLEILVVDMMGNLIVEHGLTRHTLVDYFPDLAWSKVTAEWFNLDLLLRDQRAHNASFGSDQERLDCLFPSLVYELGDYRPIPTSSGRPQALSDIPDDIPEDYLDKVFRAHYSRILSQNSQPTPKSDRATPSSTTACRPTKRPTPKQWALSQVNNDTAQRLIENTFHRDDLDLGQKRLNKVKSLWSVVAYSDTLNRVGGAMDEINQRISQVLSADYRVDIPWREQIQAVNRLRYVAPFLSDIAAVRLREMSRRASRGALLVREIDRRQHKLAEDILGGFVTANFLLHFPPIEGLLVDMELMAKWVKTEVASITNLVDLRSAKFDASHHLHSEQGNHINHDIIWTKRGRYDTRSDPWGREAICWDLKKQKLVNGTNEKRCGIR
ncbi:hypothetical protein FBULB1_9862 [Fusarium bulbicola]|nr:hypothetical protein FBULB1_9862 [Fusarium bulbicola]